MSPGWPRRWQGTLRHALRSDGDPTPRERLDDPPDAASRAGAAVVLATVALFSGMGVLAGGFFRMPLAGLGVLAMAAVVAFVVGSPAARHVTLLCVLTAAAYRLGGFGPHPFPLIGGLLAYGVVVVVTPSLRESVGWLHSGSFEPPVRRLVAAAAAASVLVLPAWRFLARPDLTAHQDSIAGVPFWMLPAVGLSFAAVNAAAEEVAFRGVVLDALRSSVGVGAAVVLQAAVFGLVHYAHGVPSGVAGALLSGFYGLMLGAIRLRARGMVAPWVAHAITDLAVFALLVPWR